MLKEYQLSKHLKCRRVKETLHVDAESGSPELLKENDFSVNQSAIYQSVSIWYDQVQKMDDGKLDFDLDDRKLTACYS